MPRHIAVTKLPHSTSLHTGYLLIVPSHIDIACSTINNMTTAQKLLKAMANNPRDWQIDQVHTVAKASGLTVHCPGGSHHVVRNVAGAKISIPAHRPIKEVYIKKLVRLIQTGIGD